MLSCLTAERTNMKVRKSSIRNPFLALLTALIWGIAFVAQTTGGDAVGPYSFNCIRFLIAAIVMIPVFLLFQKTGMAGGKPDTKKDRKTLWVSGVLLGIVLFFASNTQQVGLSMGTAPGKAGFITATYIILVPVISLILFRKKCSWNVWIGVVIAVFGLYFLCMTPGRITWQFSDLLVLISAFCYTLQILIIGYYAPKVNVVRMSCIEFLICGLLSIIPMLAVELRSLGWTEWISGFASSDAWIPILYTGICSSGVGYTLQAVAQKDMNPTIISLLLSAESVFSVLAGWLILGSALTARELFGCVLMFAAIILAQLTVQKRRQRFASAAQE